MEEGGEREKRGRPTSQGAILQVSVGVREFGGER